MFDLVFVSVRERSGNFIQDEIYLSSSSDRTLSPPPELCLRSSISSVGESLSGAGGVGLTFFFFRNIWSVFFLFLQTYPPVYRWNHSNLLLVFFDKLDFKFKKFY